jgi:hypothetical protein
MRRLPLIAVGSLLLLLALACGKGSDTAPPEAPEGSWRDPECGLIWRVEQGGVQPWQGAVDSCAALELGGLTWRLASISELRCLVNGCPETAVDGDCEVADDCADVGCITTACDGCGTAESIDCYHTSELRGGCDDPHWSATPMGEETAWVLNFRDAGVSHAELDEAFHARCVSDG